MKKLTLKLPTRHSEVELIMKTLISNTSFGEFCKSKEKEFPTRNVYLAWYEEIRTNYDNFLKQPSKLEMFVPCDEDGDVLEKPEDYEKRLPNMMTEYNDEVYRYKQAKEKVLFEIEKSNYKFTIEDAKYLIGYYSTVEQFINAVISNEIMVNFNLTSNAIKQIGL